MIHAFGGGFVVWARGVDPETDCQAVTWIPSTHDTAQEAWDHAKKLEGPVIVTRSVNLIEGPDTAAGPPRQ